jgi:hypothetical protein
MLVAWFQMRSRSRLFAAVALMVGTIRLTPAESLHFAGLSPRTTMQEAQKRYPRSSFTGRHVYVSEADSHDHIYGIDLPGTGEPRVRVLFERWRRGHNDYPRCEQVAAVIKKQYGEPAVLQEFDEERSRNRRLIWRSGEDELSLLCFHMGRRPFFAMQLTITSSR